MIPRYTVSEAARLARRHPDTVRKACESGELVASQRKHRGRWVIRQDDLETWLDGEPPRVQKLPAIAGRRSPG